MNQDRNEHVYEALRLIDRIRHRLIRKHFVHLVAIFVLAGLCLSSVPLAAGKLRVQNEWLSFWLPVLTLTLSFLGGMIAAWTSKPTRETAARLIDRALGSKELFLTSLSDKIGRHEGQSIFALYCQDLRQAMMACNPQSIVPSRVVPAAKFLVVMILIDALLFATPNLQQPEATQLNRLLGHLSTLEEQGPLLSEEDQAALEKLRSATTPEELEDAALKMWRAHQDEKEKASQAIQSDVDRLHDALKQGDVNAAERLMKALKQQLEESGNPTLKKKTRDRIKELAKLSPDKDLESQLNEMGENGSGSGSGIGDPAENRTRAQQNQARHEWLDDVLVSVFTGMGKEMPSADITKSGNSQDQKPSQDSPDSFRQTTRMLIQNLSPNDRATIERYLKLRQSRQQSK